MSDIYSLVIQRHLTVSENVNISSKMAASALEWAPDSLYNTAISTIVAYYSTHRKDLKTLPENVQFDIHYKVRDTCEKTGFELQEYFAASISLQKIKKKF